MSEFSFLIQGGFDMKPLPPDLHGMFALTNTMAPHGADPTAYKEAVTADLKPFKIQPGNMGVMFESK